MERSEVICQLRLLPKMRAWVARTEDALELLNECEREIVEKMYIHPEGGATDKICEMFDIEVASVYRRRNKGLKKLADALEEMG